MDTETLVNQHLIDDGQKIVETLPQKGFPIEGAFWLKASFDGKWEFYIISPVVDSEGLLNAYRRLIPFVTGTSQPVWLDPVKITLIGPSNPIAQDVLRIYAHAPNPHVSPVRWGGIWLGNLSVEAAYIYGRPPKGK